MKNNSTNPNEDLQAIRDIMERSSRFLSLSGLSGIFAGVSAIIGVAIGWFVILDSGYAKYEEHMPVAGRALCQNIDLCLVIDALLVLGLALFGAVYFSNRKARNAGQQLWNKQTRRVLIHLMIPLAAGGLFILILMFRNHLDMIVPAMLVFYGLALVNAGKFTFGEIHYLGLTEIILGILAGIFIHYGILLWTIGFGLMHIVYGTVMYYRYERMQDIESGN
jgi:hypothetical protein